MCGRYQLGLRAEMSEHGPGLRSDVWIREFFDSIVADEPRWSIAPTQQVPVLRLLDTACETVKMRWGLIPSWVKTKKDVPLLFNARSEAVATRGAFRNAFKARRCLIPATAFIEWEKGTEPKQPWRIFLRDEQPFVFAGLWEMWTDRETGEVIESTTILTTSANEFIEPLHDRMPVMLAGEARERWMDPEATREQLEPLLVPYASGAMDRYRVSPRINVATFNGEECVLRAE